MNLKDRNWGMRIGLFLVALVIFRTGEVSGSELTPENQSGAGAVQISLDREDRASSFSSERDIEFSLSAGIRKDELDWSIAGNSAGTNPNVLSQLDWSDLESYQVSVTNRSRLLRHIYFRNAFSYAWIQDGTVRDSDYDGDNRTMEWSRSISESSGDETWDVSTAGGYAFILLNNRLLVAPVMGVSYHKQNLRITNGNQTVSARSPAPAVGPLSSQLNSTYFARWSGPWIGCDVRYLTKQRGPGYLSMAFGLSVEIHYADYYGEGNWNLRSDLAHPTSFEHDAEGYGICLSGEWLVTVADNLELTFAANYQKWSTDSGTDTKFLVSGQTSVTQLNEVNWTSSSFMVGAKYRF